MTPDMIALSNRFCLWSCAFGISGAISASHERTDSFRTSGLVKSDPESHFLASRGCSLFVCRDVASPDAFLASHLHVGAVCVLHWKDTWGKAPTSQKCRAKYGMSFRDRVSSPGIHHDSCSCRPLWPCGLLARREARAGFEPFAPGDLQLLSCFDGVTICFFVQSSHGTGRPTSA